MVKGMVPTILLELTSLLPRQGGQVQYEAESEYQKAEMASSLPRALQAQAAEMQPLTTQSLV